MTAVAPEPRPLEAVSDSDLKDYVLSGHISRGTYEQELAARGQTVPAAIASAADLHQELSAGEAETPLA